MQVFLKKSTIPFFVFITGACVLVIEILATRILAPYFGNTLYALSSVLSVVLAALSLGYFFGGKLADKYPKERLFYGIIALSGFFVIALHLIGIILLPVFGYSTSMIWGPIMFSMILFFLQSFLLGMLSPFAVKLQSIRLQNGGVGSVSGQIFFFSTFGSIAGSLSAGFLLIPYFGIDRIIFGVGVVLLVLGVASLLKVGPLIKILLAALLLLVAFYAVSSFSMTSGLYSYDGVYQKIIVYDDEFEQAPARFLLQDRNLSAAAFTESSRANELVFDYTKYYALYKVFNPNVKEALVIGGGAYSIPKALLQDLPKATIDVAEIEPLLFDVAKQYFKVADDPRLHNMIEDGRRLLVDSDKQYDLIFSDAYSSLYSIPGHLVTQEFFTIAKNKLTANGIFIANVIGDLSEGAPSMALSEMKTFQSVFPNSYFFAVRSPSALDLQNMIFIGYNSPSKINLSSAAIAKNKDPIISGLAEKQIDPSKFDFSLYSILTDNFSPVEYLSAKELEKARY